MKKIGITTTVPIEILLAAGYQPLDLNNILVNSHNPGHYITLAERAGFPLNSCAWIKGLYGVCMEEGIDTLLGVTGGDCSNTLMLVEVLKRRGLTTYSFAYPDKPDRQKMQTALEELATTFGTTIAAAEAMKLELKAAREAVLKLDEMTSQDNTVTGWENHLMLVSSSDFNGNVYGYERDVLVILEECRHRFPSPEDEIRLAYIGVPPVFARDLYRYIEETGARVVFNEIQRQFAMPEPGTSLAEQYTSYTYPYGIPERLHDIKAELDRRNIHGVIHYVQAFCHRGIADIIFRETLGVPVLTLEGNTDFSLNSQIRTRIEAFLDMIKRGRVPISRQKAGRL